MSQAQIDRSRMRTAASLFRVAATKLSGEEASVEEARKYAAAALDELGKLSAKAKA